MKTRTVLRILAPLALLACAGSASASTLIVTKSAYCGCCKHWVEHMKKAGFTVEVRDVEDVTPTARRLGVVPVEVTSSSRNGGISRPSTLSTSSLCHSFSMPIRPPVSASVFLAFLQH